MSIKQALAKANRNLSNYRLTVILSGDDDLPYTVIVRDAGGPLEGEGCVDEQDVIATIESKGQLYLEYEEEA